jgi:hypothetical protein
MTYIIKSTRSDWEMDLAHGVREAAQVHADRNERGGALENLQSRVDYLAEFVGMCLGPLLAHNFLTMDQVEQKLPYGLSIMKDKTDDDS